MKRQVLITLVIAALTISGTLMGGVPQDGGSRPSLGPLRRRAQLSRDL